MIDLLLFILPIILFFSYYPTISFGSNDTMNFELSVPLIFLIIFDIAFFIILLKKYKIGQHYAGLTDRKIFILSWFPLFATISIFWSANPTRAILTAGIIWALFFAFFALTHLCNDVKKTTKSKILKTFFISTIVICAWCWIQCILDILGVSRDTSLLCAGCTYQNFGFPHPNGFAIEPQFMGNLLLVPALTAIYLFITRKSHKNKFLICSIIFAATLFLTFSRGAIYSFGIAVVFLLIAQIVKQKNTKPLIIVPILLGSFIFTLTAQGLFATASPTSDNFITGTTKSIHHLSLGTIDFRPTPPPSHEDDAETESAFSGYVAESTDTRLELSDLAINTWTQDLKTIFFGVGLGGSGVAIHRAFPDLIGSKEIIQNQYFSILLELGIVGIILAIFGIVVIFKLFKSHQANILLFAISIAFAISLCFFAGLPNALQVYLLPPFIFMLLSQYEKS